MIETPLAEWDGESVAFLRSEWGVPLVEAYACIDSTSRRAAELARSGCRPYTVVVADEQSAGRGRRGDAWSSPRGCGLWMSVVLPPSVSGKLPHLPLVIGLATAEAIEGEAPATEVRVKWPNDLWVRGRKVAGILCESSGGVLVAGIGVNVRTPKGGFPTELEEIATSLEQGGADSVRRGRLAAGVLAAIKRYLEGDVTMLCGPALADLARRDALAGRAIDTEQWGAGIARGIAEDGTLILERADGSRVPVVAGSVRLR